ncbi:DNA-binding transcriptional LysR family regulator [Pseudochelatococcus lubricantis]|uniref:DNA-binding transcriptional LysR family regulator n=1 Tax=Pseudochelatococcus lubricantis TaxID=1538102 RepID=A0ABX0V0E5_9HYPH|nr:LysR family transcriptional regulator [Pseudochelatococcus lubricantis]NIJ58019.1 DNA-binding transcriptional LysR family regulator [Pseudochelatococcus lubricantis]
MDWDHLRIFLAVTRHGQLLAAARSLGLNHATVARRLDALERSLGTPLFDRRPAGCVPTQAGERLLPVAERIEFELLGVSESLRDEEADVSGTVRIGAPDGLGNYFLASELGALTRRHPNLVVELVPLPRTFSLSRREADLAIVLDPPAEGRLLVSRLTDYTLSVYAARMYLERAGTPISVEALGDHTVVTGVEDLAYASALDYSAALEKQAGRKFRCASVMGQIEAVRSGAGIGVLHDFAAGAIEGMERIFPEVGFRRSYYLLCHPDTVTVKRIAVLREFISRRFREERQRFVQ